MYVSKGTDQIDNVIVDYDYLLLDVVIRKERNFAIEFDMGCPGEGGQGGGKGAGLFA